MPGVNQTIKKISDLRKKVEKDLSSLAGLCGSLKEEVDLKFRAELRHQNGDYKGLEDFYALVMMIKKDNQTVIGMLNLLKRLNNLSGFDVSEIQDNIELGNIFE